MNFNHIYIFLVSCIAFLAVFNLIYYLNSKINRSYFENILSKYLTKIFK